jgi:tripartite-type tricarboxylate transporter receptor subunit TctC
VLGARLSETLGQPFVIENRAGGDGYIGFEAVTRSEPDGYTLVYSPGSSVMIAPHIVKRGDLDPTKALTPVVPTGAVSLYILLHPSVPAKDFKEFLAYARANPGKLNYGSPGNGTSPHIATEVFNREAKTKLNHVPYKGAGPALNDLLGGQIHLAFDPGVGLNAAKAGKLRMVAVAGPVRHPDFPDVPTARELARTEADRTLVEISELPYRLTRPYAAPPGIPAERAKALQEAFMAVHKDPQYLEEAAKLKLDISPISGEEILRVVDRIGSASPAILERIKKLQADNKGG